MDCDDSRHCHTSETASRARAVSASQTAECTEDRVSAKPAPATPRPGHTRWVLSAVAGIALLTTLVLGRRGLPDVPMCWFHSMTGLPCPGCGLTRSVLAIGSGEFAGAWHFNPFGYVVYGILVVLLLLPILARVAPRPAAFIESSWFINTFVAVNVAGLVVFGLARLALHWG